MKYIIDNDLHIHSKISLCAHDDKEQNSERILSYAIANNLKTICLTDHFWDETVEGAFENYKIQNFKHISASLPLPQVDGVRFLFGCETELDKNCTLGLSKDNYDLFDFIVIPTTHFHMKGHTLFENDILNAQTRAEAWIKRLDAVLQMNLPFHKIGIAHLTCRLIAPERTEYLRTLSLLPEKDLRKLFSKAEQLGVGIEINADDIEFSKEEIDYVLRPYRIAKECKCKFYMGSDAHHPEDLDKATLYFKKAVDLLELEEKDKYIIIDR